MKKYLYPTLQIVCNLTSDFDSKFEGLFLLFEVIWTQLFGAGVGSVEPSDAQTVSHSETTTWSPHSAEGGWIAAGGFHVHHSSSHTLSRDRESTRRSLAAQHVSFAFGSTHAILPLVSLFLIKDRQDTPETRS